MILRSFNFLILLFCSVSFAQLSVTDLQGNPIVDGSTYDYDTTVFEDAKIKYVISNSSTTETINALIEVVSITNADGTNCQLCVQPLCFFSINAGQTYPNTPIILAPGANNGSNDYFSNQNPGDGVNYPMTYVLRFFTVDANGNEVGSDITITYNYTPENFSTRNFDLSDLGIDMENTVVRDYLYLNTESPVSVKVYDLTSKLIKDIQLKNGRNSVEFSSLNAGYYFAQFTDEKNRTATVKILKQ